MKVNLRETVDTAVENMKINGRVLDLIRKIKKKSVNKRLIGQVKEYYAEVEELNDVLQLK